MSKYQSPEAQTIGFGGKQFLLGAVRELVIVLSPGDATILVFEALIKTYQDQLIRLYINMWNLRVILI